MEACAGTHFMARKIQQPGHQIKLISPQFVRPFVKSNKNDFVDAEAICEAASRPSMRFVQPKNEAPHQIKLISPQFVRPFVKSNKNDFVDAEAICEAASRPSMRFVQPKNEAHGCPA